MIDIVFDNGKDVFALSQYTNYDNFIEDISLTVEKEEDIFKDYTISLCGNDSYDIAFYNARSVEDIFKWYWKLRDFDEQTEQDWILAYNSLYGFTMSFDTCIDECFGEFDSNYEAAYEFLVWTKDFTPEQAQYILDYLDCTDKVIDTTFDVYNNYYFWQ